MNTMDSTEPSIKSIVFITYWNHVSKILSVQEITWSGAVDFQSPRVKSGNSAGTPPWAME